MRASAVPRGSIGKSGLKKLPRASGPRRRILCFQGGREAVLDGTHGA
jgi:hypothetical protein